MTQNVIRYLAGLILVLVVQLFPLHLEAEALVCERARFTFGDVQAATGIVSHVFELHNTGSATLLLDEVAAPCGCVSAKLSTNLLGKGGIAQLPVTIDLRHRAGVQRLAAHVRYHTLGQDDASILSLSMQGRVLGTNSVEAAVSIAGVSEPAPTANRSVDAHPVVVELFGEAGCESCATVRREILPDARALLGNRGVIIERDVFETTNFVLLASYQERFGVLQGKRNHPVSIVVDGCRYLGGVEEIRRELPGVLQERLTSVEHVTPPSAADAVKTEDVMARRLVAFSTATILLAGLVDGVNPCAFATVIFLASLLAVARVQGRGVLLMGGGFLLGTYVTYFLLGLGLFHGLKALGTWPVLMRVLNVAMALTLCVLAVISFRDAWRFRRTGQSSDVMLKMPDALRKRVHRMLRDRMSSTHLFFSGILAGTLATLVGSVCTGQLYVPTLMVLAHNPQLRAHAMRLLMLYNLAFLGPVILVMVAAWCGTTSFALANWSRRNVIWGKILLGVFFLTLAVLILSV